MNGVIAETIYHCIQCKDVVSGFTGTFGSKQNQAPFTAYTPIFKDSVDFYKWCKDNGFKHVSNGVYTRVWKDNREIK